MMPARATRTRSWLIGLAFGLSAGLVTGLLLLPGATWAAREKVRRLALGGLVTGFGLGFAISLILLGGGNAFCLVTTPCAVTSDQTPYVIVAIALVIIGALISLSGSVTGPRGRPTSPGSPPPPVGRGTAGPGRPGVPLGPQHS